jgi:hypothetical protein
MIEMGEFGADAAEIVPDARQDRLDFLGRFFREGGDQVGAADFLLAQHRADQTGDPAEQVGGLDRIEISRGAQHDDGQGADRGLAERFCGPADAGPGAKQQAVHRG